MRIAEATLPVLQLSMSAIIGDRPVGPRFLPRFVITSLLLTAFAAVPTAAQTPFDFSAYDAMAAECEHFLREGHAAQDEGDSGRALVYLDLASESCLEARAMIAAVEAAMATDDRRRIFDESFARDASTIELLISLESCTDARDLLMATSRLVDELPPELEPRYAEISLAVLRCLPLAGASGATISVHPGSPESWYSGNTIATVDATSVLGSSCVGFLPEAPSFTLHVAGETLVSLQVTGDGTDLVMGLSGPSGSFCNDDYSGVDPALSEYLMPGDYDLYIGEYAPLGYGADYTLGVSTTALGGTGYSSAMYGELTIDPGDELETLRGYIYGWDDASASIDPACEGWIAGVAHRVHLSAESMLWWGLFPDAPDTDMRLMIRGGGSTWCRALGSEDTLTLFDRFPAGSYDVWGGEASPWGRDYSLVVGTAEPAPPDPSAEPIEGELEIGPSSDPIVRAGVVEGTTSAAVAFGAPCAGVIAELPHWTLAVSDSAQYAVMVESRHDRTLVIVGESGVRCNDDWGGHNPAIFDRLEAGTYRIYVGDWGARGEFDLTIQPIGP